MTLFDSLWRVVQQQQLASRLRCHPLNQQHGNSSSTKTHLTILSRLWQTTWWPRTPAGPRPSPILMAVRPSISTNSVYLAGLIKNSLARQLFKHAQRCIMDELKILTSGNYYPFSRVVAKPRYFYGYGHILMASNKMLAVKQTTHLEICQCRMQLLSKR